MATKSNQTRRSRGRFITILKTVIIVPLLIVALLLTVAVLRTLLLKPAPSYVLPSVGQVVDLIDTAGTRERAQRLAGALRIKTVSYDPGRQEFKELVKMREYLEKSFPLVHKCRFITREVINEYSLLYTVRGSANSTTLLPYILASHFDVVPADPTKWEEPPFSGNIVNDTFIYGRGALDDKTGVLAILEALEYMLKHKERPKRDFYLAFGHDEEVHGGAGAKMLAKTLQERGVDKFDFLIDEGFPLTKGIVPGTDKIISMLGVSEKGHVTLELSVDGSPGHSSFPPSETSLGILAAAVARLEQHPLPSMFGTGPEWQTFHDVAPHCSFFYRLLFGNLWLFNGVLSRVLSMKPLTNAMVRTTTAITMFHSGIKENIVPQSAEAMVNFRIHPSQSVAEVVDNVRDIIDDPRVIIKRRGALNSAEAHPISPSGVDDVPYQLVAATVRQVYKDSVVVPATFIANTDTRYYLNFTRHIFRMFPFVLTPEDTVRIHGHNERISIKNYENCVNFYYRLIKNADMLLDHEPRAPEEKVEL